MLCADAPPCWMVVLHPAKRRTSIRIRHRIMG